MIGVTQNRNWVGHVAIAAIPVFFAFVVTATVFAQSDMPWTKVKCQVEKIRAERNPQPPSTPQSRLLKKIGICDYQTAIELIESGIDPNFEEEGNTPLDFAVSFGENSIIQGLLQHGADPNRTNRKNSWSTALMGASVTGNFEGARLLLFYGAKPNMRDVYRSTALIDAAGRGDAEIVRLLLAHGADPRLRDRFGKTATVRAAEAKHPEIVKLLETAVAK